MVAARPPNTLGDRGKRVGQVHGGYGRCRIFQGVQGGPGMFRKLLGGPDTCESAVSRSTGYCSEINLVVQGGVGKCQNEQRSSVVFSDFEGRAGMWREG